MQESAFLIRAYILDMKGHDIGPRINISNIELLEKAVTKASNYFILVGWSENIDPAQPRTFTFNFGSGTGSSSTSYSNV